MKRNLRARRSVLQGQLFRPFPKLIREKEPVSDAVWCVNELVRKRIVFKTCRRKKQIPALIRAFEFLHALSKQNFPHIREVLRAHAKLREPDGSYSPTQVLAHLQAKGWISCSLGILRPQVVESLTVICRAISEADYAKEWRSWYTPADRKKKAAQEARQDAHIKQILEK